MYLAVSIPLPSGDFPQVFDKALDAALTQALDDARDPMKPADRYRVTLVSFSFTTDDDGQRWLATVWKSKKR